MLGLPNSLPHRVGISVAQESRCCPFGFVACNTRVGCKGIAVEAELQGEDIGGGGGEVARFGGMNERSCRFGAAAR